MNKNKFAEFPKKVLTNENKCAIIQSVNERNKTKEIFKMENTYRIYIKSNKNPRTINTPMMGRTNYELIAVDGKDAFVNKLNELVANGETIREVRYGWGGSYVDYWKYINK
jgi:hypothetical protein